MSLLDEKYNAEQTDSGLDQSALFETLFIDYVNHMNDDERKEFLESAEVKALTEANGGVNRRTIVRLSKQDDYNRRITLAAMEKAKQMILKLKEDKGKNEPILNKIYIDDKKVNVEEYKKVEEKLVNYMIFLNAKQNLVNLYKKRNERKLILFF